MLFIFRFFGVFFVMFFEFGLFSPSPSSTALLTSRVEDPVWISWSGPNKRASVDFWNRNNKGVDTFFWTSRVRFKKRIHIKFFGKDNFVPN